MPSLSSKNLIGYRISQIGGEIKYQDSRRAGCTTILKMINITDALGDNHEFVQ